MVDQVSSKWWSNSLFYDNSRLLGSADPRANSKLKMPAQSNIFAAQVASDDSSSAIWDTYFRSGPRFGRATGGGKRLGRVCYD